jgi:ketosteroid isomerase-like protein
MLLAFVVLGAISQIGCGGEEPPPQAPPPPPAQPAPPPPPAPTAEAPPPAPAKPTMAELIPQTLKAVGDAFNAHDAAKFAANYTPDVSATMYGMMEAHSRDDVQKEIQQFFDMSSDAKGSAAMLFAKGNTVAVDWVAAGTMTGDFMGMKATKKPFGAHRLVVCTLNEDGLISSSHEYADVPGMMAQLKGAKDAPPVPMVPATTDIHFAKNSPDEDKLVDWFKGFNDSFNKGDFKAVNASLAQDIDITFFWPGGGEKKGLAEVEKFHTELGKKLPGAQFAIVNAWGVDGFVVAERTITAKMKGKEETMHVGEILQPNADGKLQRGWVFANMAEVMPKPAAPMAKPAAPMAKPAAPAGGAAPAKPAPAKPAAPPAKK